MKLLFVEDDRIIASGLCYSLTQEGYLVTHCVDVKSAKTTLYENSFDLAILDLSLPDGSGYDLCQLIKAKEDIPVIFLTAIDDEVNDIYKGQAKVRQQVSLKLSFVIHEIRCINYEKTKYLSRSELIENKSCRCFLHCFQ